MIRVTGDYRHLRRAGHVGKFYIASEEAISKGVRRIVAVSGPEADRAWQRSVYYENLVNELKSKTVGNINGADRQRLKATNLDITNLNQVCFFIEEHLFWFSGNLMF